MAGWGTCYSASNNIHFNFPPIMNDGRNWASWQPEAVINNRIQSQENIHTNWAYRQYMVKNGIEIITNIKNSLIKQQNYSIFLVNFIFLAFILI